MTIFQRIALLITGTILTMGIAITVLSTDTLRHEIAWEQKTRGIAVTRSAVEAVVRHIIEKRLLDATGTLKRLRDKDASIAYAYVVGFDGSVAAHSFDGDLPAWATVQSRHAQDESFPATQNDGGAHLHPGDLLDVSVPLIEGTDGRLHVGFDTSRGTARIEKAVLDLLFAVFAIAIVALTAALLIAKRISRPLAVLIQAIDAHRDGGRLPDLNLGHSEIAALRSAFDNMIERRNDAEAEIRQFKTTVDRSLDCVFMFNDTDLRFTYVNAGAMDQVGYTYDEMMAMTPYDIKPDYDEEKFRAAIAPLLEGLQNSIMIETIHEHCGGALIPVEISLQYTPITDGHRQFIAFVRDISERKHAEKALLDANEGLERLVASRTSEAEAARQRAERYLSIAGTMIVALDDAGRITLINRKGCEVLGFRPDDLVGKNLFDTVVAEDAREEARRAFDPIHAANATVMEAIETPVLTQSGERRLITWHNAVITDEVGRVTGVLTSGEDITIRRQKATELRAAKEEAETANRAKSEFLSSMSHELRTPLNAILGFGQLLETDRDDPLSDSQKSSVEFILKGGQHLLDLINEILDLSRIEAGRMALSLEAVEPASVFDECLTLTLALAEKRGISIDSDTSTLAHSMVTADYTRLKQILLNLISNAIKYNHDSGQVTVSCAEVTPGFLRINITDTGPGIPMERRDELFKPFSRLGQENGTVEGTGIGLTLTKRLLELMDGHIGYETTIGKGSTFWAELPLANPTASSLPQSKQLPHQRLLHAVDPEEAQILYVEDNPANLKLVEKIVSRIRGVHLISAHNAELGLELALAHHPDAIILDINLPGMDGFEALAKLRSYPETRGTPVLALSALAMPRDIEKGLRAGFREYLTKPIRVKDVTAALYRTLPHLEDMQTEADNDTAVEKIGSDKKT